MNKEEYENWFKYRININPCSFEGGIINECRKMDKADVYQWLVNDELKIIELKEKLNQLETNRDEAIKEIKKRSTPEVAQLYIEILERGKE